MLRWGQDLALVNILQLLVGILGLSTNNVLMVNETGLKIVRIQIDKRTFEEVSGKVDEILVSVTPQKHDMVIFFKGGGSVKWPAFDFEDVHEVIFYRTHHHEIRARTET